MTQDDINRAEWENADNWSSSFPGVYFSKKDQRVWVPKQVPSFGRTINLAHPAGAWWLVGFLVVPWIVVALLARRVRSRV
jgi:uncharacterized membrane protein